MIRCTTGVKNWASLLKGSFYLTYLQQIVYKAIKEIGMSGIKQKKDILQGNFSGFFSYFSGVCPVLM